VSYRIRSWIAWTSLFGLTVVGSACNTRVDFDVPSTFGMAGSSGSGSGSASASGQSGATIANPATGGVTTGGAATGGRSNNVSGYPNIAECTHHCKEHALVCAAEWLRCAECNADSDCTRASRGRCDTVLHRCFECGMDSDCLAGYVCEKTSRHCVPSCAEVAGTSAETASDDFSCPSGMTCNEGVHRCASCATDGECATSMIGKRCQAATQQCVGCLADGDCTSVKPYCDPVEFACVSCRDSGDCGDNQCDAAAHVCE